MILKVKVYIDCYVLGFHPTQHITQYNLLPLRMNDLMENSLISKLLTQYRQKRNKAGALSYEQFEQLLLFFPGLLITASDGVVDDEEWVYIKYLAKFTSSVFNESLSKDELLALQDSYFKEFKYLLENLEEWESIFIETLRQYLEENEDMKDSVSDALYLFADASGGTSEEEEEAIERLTQMLALNQN